jgi:hypothetical protein
MANVICAYCGGKIHRTEHADYLDIHFGWDHTATPSDFGTPDIYASHWHHKDQAHPLPGYHQPGGLGYKRRSLQKASFKRVST